MAQLVDRTVIPFTGTGNLVADRPYPPPSMDRTRWVDPLPTFCYQAHGLTILSDLECPELTPSHALPASHAPLIIRIGPISKHTTACQTRATGCEITSRRLHLWVDDVADFLALAGKTILIDPVRGSDPTEIRLYLLGSMIGAILHQRGVMVLHGSAVRTPVGAVAFVADRGVGKSTLAVAMHRAGYPMLTDDLCTVRRDPERGLWVASGLRRVKLHPETAARLGLDVGEGFRLGREREKRAFMLVTTTSEDRPPWTPLAAVYALDVGSVRRPKAIRLGVREAYRALILHTYRRQWVRPLGLQEPFFQNVAAIVGRLPVFRLVRPDAGLEMDALIRLIEKEWAP